MSADSYIIDGARSPIGLKNGAMVGVRSDDLCSMVIKGLMARNANIPAKTIEDVVVGCAFPEGPQGMLMARAVSILSDLPIETGGKVVNRFCGSSMDSVHQLSQAVISGDIDVGIAVGVEDMFGVPMGGFNPSFHPKLYEKELYIGMGDTAEILAKDLDISREDQEDFAINSHEKALAAIESGNFDNEIIPIKKESKAPVINGWQNTKATPEDIENWANNLHQGGYGVLTSRTPAIDIDCHDKAITQKVVDYCERALGISPKRVGLPPKILLVYKTEIPFKKIFSPTFKDPSGTKHKVEILGEGQQFVAFGIHPETKKPYSWPEKSILEIPHNQLPLITMEQAQKVVDYFESIVPNNWKIFEKGTHLKTNKSQDPLLNHKPPLDLEPHEIKNILNKIDPDESYDRWVKAGMGLYHQFNGKAEGLEIWDEWSSQGQKYKIGECEEKWKTFSPDLENVNPITFATVLGWLKEKTVDHQTISCRPLSIDFLELRKKLGPTNWLVKDYIEQNTTGLFFGDPGSYKSFLALDIAYHCASGKDWHGCKVVKGPVYYIAGEGHGGIVRRQEAWIKHHEPDLSDMHFRLTEGAMDFYDAKSAELITRDIEEWAETAGNPVLIVIDTLARNFNGDENSAGDMGKFINNVNQYLRVPFGCVVLIVHHTGHSEKKRARGSTALRAGIDFEYRVEKAMSKN